MEGNIGGSTTCKKCGATRPAEFIQCVCEIQRNIKKACAPYDDIGKELAELFMKRKKDPTCKSE